MDELDDEGTAALSRDPHDNNGKARCACPWDTRDWLWCLIGACVVLAIGAIITVAIGAAQNVDADAVQRYDVRAPAPLPTCAGENATRAKIIGWFRTDTSSNLMSYSWRTVNTTAVQAVAVHGPVPDGQNTAPVWFYLCGSNPYVCDTTTTPGRMRGTLNTLPPGLWDPRPFILAIRDDPTLYYLEFLTAACPASPGAFRVDLGPVDGIP